MKIVASLYRFRLTLKSPLVVKNITLAHREGFLVKIEDENGAAGWGEVSPLPEFSLESLPQAEEALHFLLPRLTGESFPDNFFTFARRLQSVGGKEFLFPSIRFGLEMAYLMLQSRRLKRSPAQLLTYQSAAEIPVNAVLPQNSDAKSVAGLVDAGYRTIKLKIDGEHPAAEIDRVRRISQEVAGRAVLRLDANQTLRLPEAMAFAAAVKDCPIEYFEEPLQNPAELTLWAQQTDIPLALDESLLKNSLDFLAKIPGVSAYVYKPGIYGGIQDALETARVAKARGVSLVLSSGYQTELSIYFLANLAAALDQEPTAMGLGTSEYIREPLFTGIPRPGNGKICLNHGKILEVMPNQKYLRFIKRFS